MNVEMYLTSNKANLNPGEDSITLPEVLFNIHAFNPKYDPAPDQIVVPDNIGIGFFTTPNVLLKACINKEEAIQLRDKFAKVIPEYEQIEAWNNQIDLDLIIAEEKMIAETIGLVEEVSPSALIATTKLTKNYPTNGFVWYFNTPESQLYDKELSIELIGVREDNKNIELSMYDSEDRKIFDASLTRKDVNTAINQLTNLVNNYDFYKSRIDEYAACNDYLEFFRGVAQRFEKVI